MQHYARSGVREIYMERRTIVRLSGCSRNLYAETHNYVSLRVRKIFII